MSNYRAIQIINNSIQSLGLQLKPYVVLTEVGSNNYIYTPIIPLLAGARKVFAWTKDSPYGKGQDIVNECLQIVKFLGFENRIEFAINKRNVEHIKEADIITNSGFIRPIDKEIIENTKNNISIPLMFESWEIREQDLDLKACTSKAIKVAGTWESHPLVNVFDYVKELTLKLIFEAGYEIRGNSFIVWSKDHFGEKAVETLKLNGAKEVILTNNYNELIDKIKGVDVILLFDYHEARPYFGKSGLFDLEKLKSLNDYFGIIHLYGDVDFQYLLDNQINVYPKRKGKALNMSFTLSHVGLIPVIKLLVAGFKVGQELLEDNVTKISQPINF